jgi:hypothetical protein
MSQAMVRKSGLAAILAVVAYAASFAALVSVGEPPGVEQISALLSFVNDQATAMTLLLWVLLVTAVLTLGALPAFHQLLRAAGGLVSVGVAASIVGSVFSMMFLLTLVGVAYELAPAYAVADASARLVLDAVGAMLWTSGAFTHSLSHFFLWGVGGAALAYASLKVRAVPAWAAWLGLAGCLLLGYPGALESVPPVRELATVAELIGTVLYVVWLLLMGIAALRYESPAAREGEPPVSVSEAALVS